MTLDFPQMLWDRCCLPVISVFRRIDSVILLFSPVLPTPLKNLGSSHYLITSYQLITNPVPFWCRTLTGVLMTLSLVFILTFFLTEEIHQKMIFCSSSFWECPGSFSGNSDFFLGCPNALVSHLLFHRLILEVRLPVLIWRSIWYHVFLLKKQTDKQAKLPYSGKRKNPRWHHLGSCRPQFEPQNIGLIREKIMEICVLLVSESFWLANFGEQSCHRVCSLWGHGGLWWLQEKPDSIIHPPP